MSASEWGYRYIVAWYPDGRWRGWWLNHLRDAWVPAGSGKDVHLGNSSQLHRKALIDPPPPAGDAS